MLFTSNGCRKCIFLHENLKEVVYIEPSPRYPLSISNLACKLIKSLYSLKKLPEHGLKMITHYFLYFPFWIPAKHQ